MKRKNGEGKGRRLPRFIAILVMSGLAGASWAEADKSEDEGGLWTNTYIVPPNIHRELEARAKEVEKEQEEDQQNREGLIELLERCGVLFPGDALAQYNPSTSTLIVRNTKEQMAKFEALLKRLLEDRRHEQIQVFVTFKEIRYSPKKLGKENVGKQLVDSFFFKNSQEDGDRITKATDELKWVSSEDDLLEEMSRPPKPTTPASGGTVAGVLTDPQFQMVIRALSQKKGVEIIAAPALLLRSGQGGLSQVGLKRWGVVPVIGPDNLTIDLSLLLPPEGKALFRNKPLFPAACSASVSIYDGTTVVYLDKVKKDVDRIVFVTAKLVDPAGLESKPKPQSKDAEKPKAAPVQSRPAAEIEKERQANRAADKIALRGYDKLLKGDFKGAAADFEAALEKLPEGHGTRRDSFSAQLRKAKAELKQLPAQK